MNMIYYFFSCVIAVVLGLVLLNTSGFPSRTMGYQQEVVERVVKETGQTEDIFLVLEKIVEETKRYVQEGKGGERGERANPSSSSSISSSVTSSTVASSTVSRAKVKECVPAKLSVDTTGKSTANIKPARSNGFGHRRHCSSGGETKTQQVPPPSLPTHTHTPEPGG